MTAKAAKRPVRGALYRPGEIPRLRRCCTAGLTGFIP